MFGREIDIGFVIRLIEDHFAKVPFTVQFHIASCLDINHIVIVIALILKRNIFSCIYRHITFDFAYTANFYRTAACDLCALCDQIIHTAGRHRHIVCTVHRQQLRNRRAPLITKLYIASTVNIRFVANAAFGRDRFCPMHGKATTCQVSAVMSITAQIFEDHITGTADLRLALNCCSRTAT